MGLAISIILIIVALALAFFLVQMAGLLALVGIIIGGVLIGFGVHFVPVGGAPAAMGQAPGIATGVAMRCGDARRRAGLAGLFGGAWAAPLGFPLALAGGAIGGGLLMAITCTMVNVIYIFGMGIPAASGKVAKDPITGDTFPEYKSQGTEGHGLPFVSWVGGVVGGALGGLGGTLIYLELLDIYQAQMPALLGATVEQIAPIAISLAGVFAVGMFLMNAVLAAYNITGTIEGPHDPKFKRFPRAIIAAAAASAVAGIFAIGLLELVGVF
ncbi:tetrahydromethanopterin S-methyltransferase subunit D [Methanoculleus bourgensis]|uniref:Tetrahydromethanopterin S-methyltransferase subunit D n=1 Tax=Methanoculleus bourgensis TaxID=83986 RepID=A0A0X3BNQ3_9EURY|nr:Tetrahydromethanopterin S-methyltransferase subunit D [Methanoculleus bourgensis]